MSTSDDVDDYDYDDSDDDFVEYDEDYLYLDYLREHNEQKEPPNPNKFYHKFNRLWTLILGAYICNIDLMSGCDQVASSNESFCDQEDRQEESGGNEPTQSASSAIVRILCRCLPKWPHRSAWRRQLKMGWISGAIMALYLVCALLVILNLAYLYRHDIGRLRLKRVREWRVKISEDPDWNRTVINEKFAREGRRFHNQRMKQSLGALDPNLSNEQLISIMGQYEETLEREINETRRTLSYLGDKFINVGVAHQCIFLIILALGIIVYLIFEWGFQWINQHDIQLHRDLVDCAREQRRVDACCEHEVLKYLESERVYAFTVPKCARSGHEHGQPCQGANFNPRTLQSQMESNQCVGATDYEQPNPSVRKCIVHGRAYDPSRTSCRLLMQLLTSGALKPMNRSNKWLDRRAKLQFVLQINILYYCIMCDTSIFVKMNETGLEGFDIGEVSAIVCLVIMDSAVNQHFTTLILFCLEQFLLASRILRLINDCIILNKKLFALMVEGSIAATGGGVVGLREKSLTLRGVHHKNGHKVVTQRSDYCEPPEWCPQNADDQNKKHPLLLTKARACEVSIIADKMNSNYLFTLITYKVFVAQFASFRRTMNGVFIITFSGALIFPLIARFHLPYLEQENHETGGAHRMRMLAIILSVLILLIVDLAILPLCFVQSRCHLLYNALFSLLAHISEVRQHELGAGIYNEHAVTILIKELSIPSRMLEQFVVKSLGFGGTFASLVKLHFYWGLLALSILLDTLGEGNFFGSFMSDPLGVWNFSFDATSTA